MDNNYEGRKSINLSKEKDGKRAVREAYPVYNNNPDSSQLNQQEYRNQKSTSSYQNNSTSNYNQSQNQNLNHYYDYNDPQPMPTEDMYGQQGQPPVHHLPNQQSGHTSRYVQRQDVYGEYIPPQQVVQMQPQQYPQQVQSKYCKYCGGRIPAAAVVCTLCGQQVEQLNMGGMPQMQPQQVMYRNDMPGAYPLVNVSSKSKTTAIVLAALGFIGVGGLHRLYSGKIVSGLLYLFTGGLCGIGTIVDLLKIASDTFTDGAGFIIKK